MLNTLRTRINKFLFDVSTRGIRSTPPVRQQPGKAKLVSLVCHRDVDRYLISIKSVYHYLGEGEIVVLNDGTLTPQDIATLDHHLDGPRYYHVDEIDTGACPTYICWKRLFLILDLCQDDYVIQVDSDIVAQGPIDEAIDAVANEEAFIIVNRQNPGRIRLADMPAWLSQKGWQQDNLQLNAERSFAGFPDAESRYYARGTAAFVGFPRQCATREQVEQFSRYIESQVGPEWRTWGSEQTTTNYVIANAPKLRFLEYPRYLNHMPNLAAEQGALVHYFGSHRYDHGRYGRAARRAIRQLNNSGTSGDGSN